MPRHIFRPTASAMAYALVHAFSKFEWSRLNSLALDYADQNEHNGDNKQDMDKTADGVG
ncbi:MAG TPA: hypothetical protein VK731_07780 [Candidatus Cybelea sp.]|nr:hypothetical protein [Candidatus Cybelea sp.]